MWQRMIHFGSRTDTMKRETTEHHMDGVYVLLLFAVFAGCILLVLLSGASSYEKLVKRDQTAYNERTGIQYLVAKLRHADSTEGIYVGSFSDRNRVDADGINVLYLPFIGEDGPVDGYYTEIYYYDGYIREMLCEENSGLNPEDGNEILPAKGLSITRKGNLITFTLISEQDNEQSLTLMVRSGGSTNEV